MSHCTLIKYSSSMRVLMYGITRALSTSRNLEKRLLLTWAGAFTALAWVRGLSRWLPSGAAT